MVGDTANSISLANLYPAAKSVVPSTGSEADSIGVDTEHVSMLSSIEHNFSKGMLLGKPVSAYVAMVIILFAGMWLATRFKGSAGAANVRFSVYNVIAITALAIVGPAIAKVLAAQFSHYLGPVATVILAS
jgi:hypothetical protein